MVLHKEEFRIRRRLNDAPLWEKLKGVEWLRTRRAEAGEVVDGGGRCIALEIGG